MGKISGGFGNVDFLNKNFMPNNRHFVKYENQKIHFELSNNYRTFCDYSESKNEFSDHSGYGGGTNRYFQLIKKTELSDLERLDYLHNKGFKNLLDGEMCVVRDAFIHCVDLGEVAESATYRGEKINGTILRRITNCPYKSIKMGDYTLIIIGYTNNGNAKIVLKY